MIRLYVEHAAFGGPAADPTDIENKVQCSQHTVEETYTNSSHAPFPNQLQRRETLEREAPEEFAEPRAGVNLPREQRWARALLSVHSPKNQRMNQYPFFDRWEG